MRFAVAGARPAGLFFALAAAVSAAAGLLFSGDALAAAATPQEVRIGILAYRGAEHATAVWDATFSYLAAELPNYRFRPVPGDLAFLTAAVANRELDFVITNPGHYVELEVAHGVSRIATVDDDDEDPASAEVGAAVVVTRDQTIDHLADLRGRRVAAVASDAFGFRTAWRELAERGIDPFTDTHLDFVGFPVDAVITAVRSGQADAGIVRTCLLESLIAERKLQPGELRVVDERPGHPSSCRSSTRLYPDWPFAKLSHTPESLAKQVAKALLAMPARLGGHQWTVPVDYQPVHELYQALKIGPYQGLRQQTLGDVLWAYRSWLAVLALALMWGLIHVLRVEQLVRRRTVELQQLHDRERRRGEEMEHALRLSLIGEMASSLAHEINQPLAAIRNYARGCERRFDAQAEDGDADADKAGDRGGELPAIRWGVRQIAVQAERAAEIVRGMRDFVRKRPSAQLLIDPTGFVDDALLLFRPTAEAKRLAISTDIQSPLPLVRADKVQIEEVLLNLLQNAQEAMSARPEGQVGLTVAADEGVVHVSVTDNGPGLSTEVAERLFEPFFTTKPDGLGLGLSLSRTIIEAHGGSLWATTGGDGGTTFHFTLPVVEEEEHV